MKMLVLSALLILGSQANAANAENDFVCKGVVPQGAITVKFDSWADNRQTARADVTFDIAGVGPRTYVDLYVEAGDSDLGGGDFGVSQGNWSLEFFVDAGTDKALAQYFVGSNNAVKLDCVKTNF